jgi:hypothetical protein
MAPTLLLHRVDRDAASRLEVPVVPPVADLTSSAAAGGQDRAGAAHHERDGREMRIYARTRLPDGRVTRMTLDPLSAGGSGSGSSDSEKETPSAQDDCTRSHGLWRILRALDQEAYEKHF